MLGSVSIDVDNTTEREVKMACEVARRTTTSHGVQLCGWGEGKGLEPIIKWIKQFNETYSSSIKFNTMINPEQPPPYIRCDINRSGWSLYGTLSDKLPHLGCILDNIPNWGLMQLKFQKTCELADLIGVVHVVPFLSLGFGRKPNGYDEVCEIVDWDYPVTLDTWCGWELNSHHCRESPRYPKWNRAPYIVIERCALNEHLFSYLKGATRV